LDASNPVRAGVTTGESSVEKVVMVTERATLPPARKVITLEAVPPGQEPRRMNPVEVSGPKPNAVAIPRARAGISRNCSIRPMSTGEGFFTIRVKSSGFRVIPMPNMITPSPGLMRNADPEKTEGKTHAARENSTIHRRKRRLRLFSIFINIPVYAANGAGLHCPNITLPAILHYYGKYVN